MARMSFKTTRNDKTYLPPRLPSYLSAIYELQPILGVPSDEQVKAIHTVIRATNAVSHVPALYDPDVSMALSQHLFDVQMAKYRSQYTYNPFQDDVTYIPPELPQHIGVALDPVVGAPSEDEMKAARAAVRVFESFANTPMFDPQLDMNLSQHLFNLQFARYVQCSAQDQSATAPTESSPQAQLPAGNSDATDHTQSLVDPVQRSTSINAPTISSMASISTENTPSRESLRRDAGSVQVDEPPPLQMAPFEQLTGQTLGDLACRTAIEESNRLLEKLGETMQDINRALIGTQNSLVRGLRASHRNYSRTDVGSYALMNTKGELPSEHGLTPIQANGYASDWKSGLTLLSDQQLAQYLIFYEIDDTSIVSGDGSEATIRQDMRSQAEIVLLRRLNGSVY